MYIQLNDAVSAFVLFFCVHNVSISQLCGGAYVALTVPVSTTATMSGRFVRRPSIGAFPKTIAYTAMYLAIPPRKTCLMIMSRYVCKTFSDTGFEQCMMHMVQKLTATGMGHKPGHG